MRVLLAGMILVCGLTLASDAAAPRVFYVDDSRGADERNGLTPVNAWKTLERVNGAVLQSGDKVLFKRGGQWRGQLTPVSGSEAGVVTYGAYGDGPKPVLLGSAALSKPELWQAAGENLWASVPLRLEPGTVVADLKAARWGLHQEAGAACEHTPVAPGDKGIPEQRLECRSAGTAPNHIQLSTRGLSVKRGMYYVLPFRVRSSKPFTLGPVVIMQNGAPYTQYADSQATPPVAGEGWSESELRFHARETASDARMTLFLGGLLPADSTVSLQFGVLKEAIGNHPIPLSVDVGNIIFDGGAMTGVKKWGVAELKSEGEYYYDNSAWQVMLRMKENPARRFKSVELALNRHIINQGGKAYVTYEDLDLRYGAAHGIGGGGTHHITVRGLDISYIGGGHHLTRPDGTPVRFGNGVEFWSGARECLVEKCRIREIYDAALTNQGDGVNVQENITYRDNVIWNSEYCFEYWNRGPESVTNNIVFEHNTCVDAGHGWGHGQRPDPNGRHLMFYDNSAQTTGMIVRNNIFVGSRDSLLRLQGREWTAELKMDQNVWWQEKGEWLWWGNERIRAEQCKAYLNSRGFDLQSAFSAPKFIAPEEHDYRLAPGSVGRSMPNGKVAGARL